MKESKVLIICQHKVVFPVEDVRHKLTYKSLDQLASNIYCETR